MSSEDGRPWLLWAVPTLGGRKFLWAVLFICWPPEKWCGSLKAVGFRFPPCCAFTVQVAGGALARGGAERWGLPAL